MRGLYFLTKSLWCRKGYGVGVIGAAGFEATILVDEGRELEAAREEVEALHGWKGANVHRWIAQRLGGANDAMQDKLRCT